MGETARVASFEALKRFRVALCRFGDVVGSSLDEAEAEIQRACNWVKGEQTGYWKKEGERRAEAFTRAKIALARKKAEKTALGGRPSCVEEEKEYKRATARLEESQRKQVNVRRWSRRIEEEAFAYQAVATGLSQAVAVDIPTALAQLDHMIAALEAYAASGAPEMQGSVAGGLEGVALPLGPEGESVARSTPGDLDEVESFRRLRVGTPDAADRAPLVPGLLDEAWRHPSGTVPPPSPVDAAMLGLPAVRVAAGDKVVLARGAARQGRIYLERLEGVGEGDSGWFIGGVPPAEPPELEAVQVADFLAVRPEFEALLELPPGSLVVVNNGAVMAVFEGNGRLLWLAPDAGASAGPAA